MRRLANWIVLAIVATVALLPLCEIVDKTDEWSQDGSDFVLYIICLFLFLGFSIRRSTVITFRLPVFRISILPLAEQHLVEQQQDRPHTEERELFLTFCDLRI